MGFVRIWQGSGEAFDMVDLFLPDVQFTTQVPCPSFPYTSPCAFAQYSLGSPRL